MDLKNEEFIAGAIAAANEESIFRKRPKFIPSVLVRLGRSERGRSGDFFGCCHVPALGGDADVGAGEAAGWSRAWFEHPGKDARLAVDW
jgi:hypothetical protein